MLLGGRWNSRGKRVIYAAATYAGALLEQLAHANIGVLPGRQMWIEIDIPDDLAIERVVPDEVPGWDTADMIAGRERGDRWIGALTSAILIVPSAVTDGMESNILINPAHPDFNRIHASEPKPVRWDPRLK
jgi:RES domain-containing protein